VFDQIWRTVEGDGPFIAVALHDGHAVRDEVASFLAIGEEDRRREEDPFTADWVTVAPTQVVGLRSRFEVDLNRPRDRAVYAGPDDAWGLSVWKGELDEALVGRSLAEYDAFYRAMRDLFSGVAERHGHFVVFDLHSYNYRRGGPDASPADEAANPQVNVGTGPVDRTRWGPLVERFMGDLRSYPFCGGPLDVRENVKFRGGHFSRWVHETFPHSACVLAIEFKKFFMDEWTGEPDRPVVEDIRKALASTVPGVLQQLGTHDR
jgi:N-formylglutamate deformylase